MPLQIMLLLQTHLMGDCAGTSNDSCRLWHYIFIKNFFSSFIEPWTFASEAEVPHFRNQIYVHVAEGVHRHDDTFVELWFAIRYFAFDKSEKPLWSTSTGLDIMREKSSLPVLPTSAQISQSTELGKNAIKEMRDHLLVKIYLSQQSSAFTFVSLSDDAGCPKVLKHDSKCQQRNGNNGTGEGIISSVRTFCILLQEHFFNALHHWGAVLGRMEQELELKVGTVDIQNQPVR